MPNEGEVLSGTPCDRSLLNQDNPTTRREQYVSPPLSALGILTSRANVT